MMALGGTCGECGLAWYEVPIMEYYHASGIVYRCSTCREEEDNEGNG
jgi:hypothetical protein